MKKIIVLIMTLFFLPLIVYANSNSVTISSSSEMKVGDISSFDFTIDFKDIKRASGENQPSTGFMMYVFELEFDDSAIDVYDIVVNNAWNVSLYKDPDSGKYYVEGVLNGNTDTKFCENKISYCDKASVSLSFGIKETDKTSTTIKVTKLGGLLVNSDGQSQLTENDLTTVEVGISTSHTISISRYEEQPRPKENTNKYVIQEKSNVSVQQEVKKETKETVSKQTNKNTNTNTNTNSNTTTNNNEEKDESNKTYNNYLKTLEIEGYKIDFTKHQAIYSIEVPEEVRELKINAISDNPRAKVEIVGADNLEENNKVIITVTAENGEEKKYIINVKRTKKENKEKGSFFEITDDQKKMAAIFAGAIIGIGIIIYIVIRIRDRKIEKGMDKW